MSKRKKPTVSEIRVRDKFAPGSSRFDVPYLLGLLKRMEDTLEQAVKCGYFPPWLAQEASALVKESQQ